MIHFFAETVGGDIVEFHAITFMFDGKLYAINEPNVMKKRLRNANEEDYVCTEKTTNKVGMFHTGYYRPTEKDVLIIDLRKIWTEDLDF